jgi:hypothetical protein
VLYEGEKDIEAKISNFLKVADVMNTIFKPLKIQKHTRISIYNTLASRACFLGMKTGQ